MGPAQGRGRPRTGPAVLVGTLPLVGRRAELAVLASVVAQARQGVGGAVVVEGEAGIGKTRLVTELLAATGEEGLRVLCGA
ncbi:MAG: AAA family ATPase, partial [Acidimicrobiales bacterium]